MADSALFSKYELEREKNIKKHEELLASLNLLKQKKDSIAISESSRKKFPKQSEKQQEPLRMKLRSRSSNNEENVISLSNELSQYEVDIPERRTGTNTLGEILAQNDTDNIDLDTIVKRLYNTSTANIPSIYMTSSVERFHELQKYQPPSKQTLLKLVPHRIYSVAFANTSKPLALAGDKWGFLGIWSPLEEDETCLTLRPHIRAVSKIYCHSSLDNQILTCSYDGTVRVLSLSHSIYETILDRENMLFYDISSVDDGKCFLVASNTGQLLLIDRRESSTKAILLHDKKISSVDMFPDRYTFCTCAHSVYIWDIRKISFDNPVQTTPLQTLSHSKAVTAARISPSGKYILTTCYDNYIRIFDSIKIARSKDTLLYKIPHNNNTGRWVTPFVAEWDPQSDELVVCGSMKKPRGIDLFHVGKSLETSRIVDENLTTIIPRLAIHPTTGMIIGGSSSGRVFAFADYKYLLAAKNNNLRLSAEQ